MSVSQTFPSVVFELASQNFAISGEHVVRMLAIDQLEPSPSSVVFSRGMIRWESNLIPAYEGRQLLSFDSRKKETDALVDLLSQREQDHKDWLKALKDSIQNNVEFTKARDPHQCAFGKWYDTFHTSHFALAQVLARFDEPHKSIHSLADLALNVTREKGSLSAINLINEAERTTLNSLLRLFSEARKILREDQKDIGLFLNYEGHEICLIVDHISLVRHLNKEATSEDSGHPLIQEVVKDSRLRGTIKFINLGALFKMLQITSK